MEKLNAWGAPYKMCVSDRAYGDYLTRDEVSHLLKTYRIAGVKRYHYTYSAYEKAYDSVVHFWSYYTKMFSVYKDGENRLNFNLYMWLACEKSSTTYKQIDRFLAEFYPSYGFTAKRLAAIAHMMMKRGYATYRTDAGDTIHFFKYNDVLNYDRWMND